MSCNRPPNDEDWVPSGVIDPGDYVPENDDNTPADKGDWTPESEEVLS